MRRWVVRVATVLVAAGGIFLLAELTQNRADPVVAGSRSEVSFEVETRRYAGSRDEAATALWASCEGTLTTTAVPPGLRHVAGDRYAVVVEPGLGENARARLSGCLTDANVDRIRGQDVQIVAMS